MIEKVISRFRPANQAADKFTPLTDRETEQSRTDRNRRDAFKIQGVVRKAGPLSQFDL